MSEDKTKRTLWPYVPVVLLGTMIGGLLVLARVASDDPSFAVERDYYAKALAWDATREQERENERLGWRLDVETLRGGPGSVELVARLVDQSGAQVERAELQVEAFHNARAAHVLAARLAETDVAYRAELPIERAGIWELRFTARRGSDKFTQIVRAEIGRETVQ
jgi:nitrogen fixation protein FixH